MPSCMHPVTSCCKGVFVISLLVKAHLSRAFVPSCVAEVIVLQLAMHVPHTRQPVSVNQLNHLRPENNPMTDSPSGLPLSAQPAWKADSQGTGCTDCCRQEFTLAWAW
ncbi:unnamed protein product [Tetraodon nigroviridis]|uniref:(spotted green pufferfish) hypothetical protein n=1 Tax=Tetraodon nigroviridis TaxID=99883 RepID=Q4RWD8_TETNG|nr:unnamed protein product [Tetraodon nigroviridis]